MEDILKLSEEEISNIFSEMTPQELDNMATIVDDIHYDLNGIGE